MGQNKTHAIFDKATLLDNKFLIRIACNTDAGASALINNSKCWSELKVLALAQGGVYL